MCVNRSGGVRLPDVMSVTFGALVGHQGGWDEILLVVGPLLFVAWLLWLAKRRADSLDHEPEPQDEPEV